MIRKPHLRLIASHSVRHGIRGGAGLVAVFLTLVVGLVLSGIVLDPLSTIDDQVDRTAARMHEQISDADRARIHDEITASVIKVGGKAINWAIEPSDTTLDYLTVERPVIISAILVLLMLVTPFLACLAGFNQTAGDISTKGFKVHVHPTGEMIAWLFQGYLRLMLLGLPYIALCAFVSCAIDSAFGSLCIALLVAYFVPLLVSVGSGINSAVHYLGYITPWGFKYWLLEPFGGKFLGGIAAMLAFTVLLLWAGLTHFSKRDL
jgi:hypothetical protein